MPGPTTLTGEQHLAALAAIADEDPRMVIARALQAARDVLDMEVAYLAHLDSAEQLFRAVLPDSTIPGVESGRRIPRSEAYCDRLIAGVISPIVPDTTADPATADLALTHGGVRSYVGVPLELPDGRLEGTLCCLSRSPDPRVAESELRFMRVLARMLGDQLARQELRRQQDVQREGLEAMALHDLKSPVTAVRGYAELLADEPGLTEAQRGYVARIQNAATQLSRLADHLLDVSRAQGEPPAEAFSAVDLGAVAREAIAFAEPGAVSAGVTIETDVGGGLLVAGDADALLRVAENLVGNAVKYTPSGGRVRVRAERDAEGILLEVADTGHGIPEAEQTRVFESFYRATNGRAAAPGSGLGLAVCHRVVEAHRGTLVLASTEGSGTTVTVRFAPYVPS